MSRLVAIMSMSLDGYVADRNDGVNEVFDWYFNSGDVEIETRGSDPMTFRVSTPSAEYIRTRTAELGAVLTGRRTFEKADGWGGSRIRQRADRPHQGRVGLALVEHRPFRVHDQPADGTHQEEYPHQVQRHVPAAEPLH